MKTRKPATRKMKSATPPDEMDDDEKTFSVLDDTVTDAAALSPALQALYSEMGLDEGGEPTVHIALIEADKESNVWRGSPDEYDLPMIAKQFGSGSYRVRVYVRDPNTGMKLLRGNRVFHQKLSPADEKIRRDALNALNNPAPASPGNDLAMLFSKMLEASNNQTAAILTAIRENKPAQVDPLHTLEGLKSVAELLRPPAAPVVPPRGIGDIATDIKTIMSVVDVIKPANVLDEDGKISSNGLLAKGIDMFTQAIQANRAQQAPAALPDNSATPAQPVQQSNDEGVEMISLFRIQLKIANGLAKADADCADFAESIFELLDDDAIQTFANDPEWFKKLCELESGCANYPAWYSKLHARLVDIAREEGILPAIVQPQNGENVKPIPAGGKTGVDS